MSSSFWLGVESRDFSQAEKERTACEAGKIQEMTLQAVFFFSQHDKNHVTQLPTAKN